jgi:hypothetical protein
LIADGGWIEMRYEYNTRSYARALYEGGMLWDGGAKDMTMEELLEEMDKGIAEATADW